MSENKIKIKWSAIDLRAYHGIEAEQELIQYMSEELAKTIDKDILERMEQELPSYILNSR